MQTHNDVTDINLALKAGPRRAITGLPLSQSVLEESEKITGVKRDCHFQKSTVYVSNGFLSAQRNRLCVFSLCGQPQPKVKGHCHISHGKKNADRTLTQSPFFTAFHRYFVLWGETVHPLAR